MAYRNRHHLRHFSILSSDFLILNCSQEGVHEGVGDGHSRLCYVFLEFLRISRCSPNE